MKYFHVQSCVFTLLNSLQIIYNECKAGMLQMLFQDLFHPHKDDEDTKSARLQARVYGELLQLFPTHRVSVPAVLNMVRACIIIS